MTHGKPRYLVSYLVPCYNHERYILDCLDSILSDAGPSDELIIVDDGSQDRSAQLIQDWHGRQTSSVPIRFWSRANKGISATLNELINASEGEFIKLVSSDDKLIPGSTVQMLEVLKQKPNILAVAGDVLTIDENNKKLTDSQMASLGKNSKVYLQDIKRAIISHWALCGPAVLFRRDFHKAVGAYDESLVVEDWSMYLRLTAADRFLYVDKVVGEYRIHSENTSMTKDISRRIKNLMSQKKAGELALPLFTGGYKMLLSAEVALLDTKIAYLRRNVFKALFHFAKYSYFKMCGGFKL